MKRYLNPVVIILTLCFAFACSDDPLPQDGQIIGPSQDNSQASTSSSASSSTGATAFVLNSTFPANGAKDIIRDTSIRLIFSHEVDPESLATAFVLTKWWDGYQYPDEILGALDTSANPEISFTPTSPLAGDYEYRFELKPGLIKDRAGRVLENPITLIFETSDNLSSQLPRVIRSLPAQGAEGVATSSLIEITFSEAMAQTSLTAAKSIKLYPTATPTELKALTTSLSVDKTNLSVKPTYELQANTAYTLRIGTEAKSLVGDKPLGQEFILRFSTGAGPDTTPLEVTSLSPANEASGIEVKAPVRISFNKPIRSETVFLDYPGVAGSIRVSAYSDGSFPLAGSLVIEDQTTVVFNLEETSAYEPGRTYYLKVEGVEAISGASLSAPYGASFTIKAPSLATLAELRAVSGPCALRLENLTMTFFRNYPKDYRAYFLQAEREGPAIMVLWKSEKAPFHTTDYIDPEFTRVNLTVSYVEEYEGMKQVTASTVEKIDGQTVTLDWVYDNLVTKITDESLDASYESRYLRLDGWLSNYKPNTSLQNRLYDLYYAGGKKVRLLVNQDLICEVTKSTSPGEANGKRVRVLAPLQRDKNGFFVKPYYYTSDQAYSSAFLDHPTNYHLMLDIVRLED